MKPGKVTQCRIECEGQDIFIIADGVKIAKRGHPGTSQAATWVSLEPGWTVRDCRDTYTDENGEEGRAIEIEYNRVRVHGSHEPSTILAPIKRSVERGQP